MLEHLRIPHYSHFHASPPKKERRRERSENVSGAGNQQERLEAEWVVGFTDGEGCFHVAFNPQPKLRLRWQVLPEFRIVQHQRDEQILLRLQSFFGCGQVAVNNGDRKELRIRGLEGLTQVVEFFEANPLRSKKLRDFELFARIIRLIREGKHLTQEGLVKAARLALSMNTRTNREASRILRDQMPDVGRFPTKIESELHGDMQRPREIAVRP